VAIERELVDKDEDFETRGEMEFDEDKAEVVEAGFDELIEEAMTLLFAVEK
jgi:hypothetical protein